MNAHLMDAVIELAAFFALSGEGTIHPDDAANQLETLSAHLHSLAPDEQAELVGYAKQRALREQERSEDPRDQMFVDFLLNLGKSFDLAPRV